MSYPKGSRREGAKDGLVTPANGNLSMLLRKVNASDFAGAADEFLKWSKAG
ncbi:hypothetical protein P3W85_14135 [Cupriavidus basilensis]|uniref:Uncharacterized protein n=1 Tax=Cupriavidus basilensis TaxID=68895 RepID=A0ABT6AN91_9BURK|nr:hypothetical protein [Cupriavidus basilensis]MDF3834085.1 hypothetical protein [Cupriavidus basilensis]